MILQHQQASVPTDDTFRLENPFLHRIHLNLYQYRFIEILQNRRTSPIPFYIELMINLYASHQEDHFLAIAKKSGQWLGFSSRKQGSWRKMKLTIVPANVRMKITGPKRIDSETGPRFTIREKIVDLREGCTIGKYVDWLRQVACEFEAGGCVVYEHSNPRRRHLH